VLTYAHDNMNTLARANTQTPRTAFFIELLHADGRLNTDAVPTDGIMARPFKYMQHPVVLSHDYKGRVYECADALKWRAESMRHTGEWTDPFTRLVVDPFAVQPVCYAGFPRANYRKTATMLRRAIGGWTLLGDDADYDDEHVVSNPLQTSEWLGLSHAKRRLDRTYEEQVAERTAHYKATQAEFAEARRQLSNKLARAKTAHEKALRVLKTAYYTKSQDHIKLLTAHEEEAEENDDVVDVDKERRLLKRMCNLFEGDMLSLERYEAVSTDALLLDFQQWCLSVPVVFRHLSSAEKLARLMRHGVFTVRDDGSVVTVSR
jgi:hypothetical protein